ncbi:MAG: DUF308 domain-containing protein [Lachnospiraceae bacterium]|nr:DUF308 domain-containing protein [Lachnospiraceae bacterium]
MTGKRIFTIILGVILVIGGFWCITTPISTSLALVWIFGIFMLVKAIADLATYSERKAMGYADGFSLTMSIISFIFALMLICSWRMQAITETVLLLFISFWLIVGGVISIVGAIQLKRALNVSPVFGIIMGILMIVVGFIGIAHPILGAISIGVIIGVNILVLGIDNIVNGIVAPKN